MTTLAAWSQQSPAHGLILVVVGAYTVTVLILWVEALAHLRKVSK